MLYFSLPLIPNKVIPTDGRKALNNANERMGKLGKFRMRGSWKEIKVTIIEGEAIMCPRNHQ